MSSTNTSRLRNLPSIKALLFFNVAAKHLNLVRAGEELHLTQGALSRQLKALEDHLGVELFKRGPRGLSFTQEGELLYDYSRRAFDTLGSGIRHLSLDADRETLVVSVARSFAICVLAKKVTAFVQANPWIDLRIDIHRYFADLESSGADISIRLGSGDWQGYRMLALTDDRVGVVCSPAWARKLNKLDASAPLMGTTLLRNAERDYWDKWHEGTNRRVDLESATSIHFNDSATMIEAVKAGAGLCLTRLSLVSDSLSAGTLAQPWAQELHDGLRYHALCAQRSSARRAVNLFMEWLTYEFGAAGSVQTTP
jgi:LysR family transcriptional regulator, glycine cleavage system transcriptional activator